MILCFCPQAGLYMLPSKHSLKAMVERKHVRKQDYIALTSDMWTSLNTHALLGVSGHFIYANFSFKTMTAGLLEILRGPHLL